MFIKIFLFTTPDGIFTWGSNAYTPIKTEYTNLSEAISGILERYYETVDSCHSLRIDHSAQKATLVF